MIFTLKAHCPRRLPLGSKEGWRDRGPQASEEAPSPVSQSRPDEQARGTEQPTDCWEVEATAPQLLKSRSALGSRGRGWEEELPEQKLGGWLGAGPGGPGMRLEEVQTMMGARAASNARLWGATEGFKAGE